MTSYFVGVLILNDPVSALEDFFASTILASLTYACAPDFIWGNADSESFAYTISSDQ